MTWEAFETVMDALSSQQQRVKSSLHLHVERRFGNWSKEMRKLEGERMRAELEKLARVQTELKAAHPEFAAKWEKMWETVS